MDKGKFQEVKTVLRSLLVSSPNKTTIDTLNRDFKEIEGQCIPFRTLGFPSLEMFLRSISDTVRVVGGGSNAIVEVVANEKTIHIQELVRNQRSTPSKSKGSRNERPIFKHAAIRNDSRNWGNEKNAKSNNPSNSVYKFNEGNAAAKRAPLNFKPKNDNYGEKKVVNSVVNEIMPIADINVPSSSQYIRNIAMNSEDRIQLDYTQELIQYNKIRSCAVVRNNTASVAFRTWLATVLLPFMIPKQLNPGLVATIYITECDSPFKFWFYLLKDDTKSKLIWQLRRFYTSLDKDEYCMKKQHLRVGHVCAVLYKDLWYRAEILNVNDDQVKVFLLDFGNVFTVPLSDVKTLAKDFTLQPVYAFRGCLTHIQPTNGNWTKKATAKFLSLVTNFEVRAKIFEINQMNRIVYIRDLFSIDGTKVVDVCQQLKAMRLAIDDDTWENHIY